MAEKETRKINSGITVHVPATTKGGATTRTFTNDDDFDEVQEHLTAADVERLTTPHSETGIAPLEGKWAGKLKERTPMQGSAAFKAAASGGTLPEPPKPTHRAAHKDKD